MQFKRRMFCHFFEKYEQLKRLRSHNIAARFLLCNLVNHKRYIADVEVLQTLLYVECEASNLIVRVFPAVRALVTQNGLRTQGPEKREGKKVDFALQQAIREKQEAKRRSAKMAALRMLKWNRQNSFITQARFFESISCFVKGTTNQLERLSRAFERVESLAESNEVQLMKLLAIFAVVNYLVNSSTAKSAAIAVCVTFIVTQFPSLKEHLHIEVQSFQFDTLIKLCCSAVDFVLDFKSSEGMFDYIRTSLFEQRKKSGTYGVVKHALMMAQDVINMARSHFFDLNPKFFIPIAFPELKALVEKVWRYQSGVESGTIKKNPGTLQDILAMDTQLKMLELRSVDKEDAYQFQSLVRTCRHAIDNLKAVVAPYGNRVAGNRQVPTFVYLYGETGVGKSTLTIPLTTAVLAKYLSRNEPWLVEEFTASPGQFIYARQQEHKFWDGYVNQHACVWDDFGQQTDAAGVPDNEYMDIIRCSNTFTNICHMANLAQKGVTAFVAKFCLASTNSPNPITQSIQHPSALKRRFNFVLCQVIKPEFASAATKSKPARFRKLHPRFHGVLSEEYVEYEEYDFGVNDIKFTGKRWTFEQLRDELVADMEAKKKEFDALQVLTDKVIGSALESQGPKAPPTIEMEPMSTPPIANEWEGIVLEHEYFERFIESMPIEVRNLYFRALADMTAAGARNIAFSDLVLAVGKLAPAPAPTLLQRVSTKISHIEMPQWLNKTKVWLQALGILGLALGTIWTFVGGAKNEGETQSGQKFKFKGRLRKGKAKFSTPAQSTTQAGDLGFYDVVATIKANQYQFSVTGALQDGSFIVVTPGKAILPYHYRQWARTLIEECDEEGVEPTIIVSNDHTGEVYEVTPDFLANGELLPGKIDTMVVQLPFRQHEPHKKIIQHFAKMSDIKNLRNEQVGISLPRNITMLARASYKRDGVRVSNNWGSDYTLQGSIEYVTNVFPGMCGAPVVIVNKKFDQKIVGMHVAGNLVTGFGMAEVVSSEDFTSIETQGPGVVRVGECLVKLSTSPTKIIKSVLHGSWKESTWTPAKTVPYRLEGRMVDPLEAALAKYDVPPNLNASHWSFEPSIEAVKHKILQFRPLCDPDDIRLLSDEETVKGFDLLGPLDRSTCPGWPWIKDDPEIKRKAFGTGPEVVFSGPDFERVKQFESSITSGEAEIVFYDFLKDEENDITRAYKSRMISCSPIQYTFVFRKYFGAFMSYLIRFRIVNESCVGVNKRSREWQDMWDYLQFRKKCGGDFSGYDQSHMLQIIHEWCDCAQRWYGDSYGQERKNIISYLLNSKHVNRLGVFILLSGYPSGNPATTFINCFGTQTYMRQSFLICGHDADEDVTVEDFEEFCRLLVYGDDNDLGVHDSIVDWYNPKAIQQAMSQIGLRYTDSRKRTEIDWEDDEITFLGCSYRFCDEVGQMVAPLDLDTVLESPFWTKKGRLSSKIVEDKIVTLLEELALHGKEVFDHWVPIIRQSCYQHNVNFPFSDRKTILFRILTGPNGAPLKRIFTQGPGGVAGAQNVRFSLLEKGIVFYEREVLGDTKFFVGPNTKLYHRDIVVIDFEPHIANFRTWAEVAQGRSQDGWVWLGRPVSMTGDQMRDFWRRLDALVQSKFLSCELQLCAQAHSLEHYKNWRGSLLTALREQRRCKAHSRSVQKRSDLIFHVLWCYFLWHFVGWMLYTYKFAGWSIFFTGVTIFLQVWSYFFNVVWCFHQEGRQWTQVGFWLLFLPLIHGYAFHLVDFGRPTGFIAESFASIVLDRVPHSYVALFLFTILKRSVAKCRSLFLSKVIYLFIFGFGLFYRSSTVQTSFSYFGPSGVCSPRLHDNLEVRGPLAHVPRCFPGTSIQGSCQTFRNKQVWCNYHCDGHGVVPSRTVTLNSPYARVKDYNALITGVSATNAGHLSTRVTLGTVDGLPFQAYTQGGQWRPHKTQGTSDSHNAQGCAVRFKEDPATKLTAENFDSNDSFMEQQGSITEKQVGNTLMGLDIEETVASPENPAGKDVRLQKDQSDGIDNSITSFLERPYPVHEATITTATTGLVTSVVVPSGLFALPIFRAKMDGVYSWQGDLKATLQINAQRFQQGRLILGYVPYKAGTERLDNLAQVTQLPHVELDIGSQTQVTLDIPFNNIFPITLVSSTVNDTDMGRVFIYVYSPLASASASDAEITLWLSLPNSTVKGKAFPMITQGPRERRGAVEDTLDKVSRASKVLSKVPVVGTIADSVGWFANIGASVASIFGWSSPRNLSRVDRIANAGFYGMSNGDEESQAAVIAPHKDSGLYKHSLPTITEDDEMAVGFVASKFAYVGAFNWSTSNTGSLASIPVSLEEFYQSVTNARVYAPVSYIGSLFQEWRGTLKFRFKVVKTEFHTGRLAISFVPTESGSTPVTTNTVQTYLSRTIVDLREGHEFEVHVPFTSRHASKNWRDTLGYLDVRVLNVLRAPTSVTSSIVVLWEVAGGDDFCVAGPNCEVPRPWLPISAQGPATIAAKPVGGRAIPDSLEMPKYVWSSDIKSLRVLMRQYEMYFRTTESSPDARFRPDYFAADYGNNTVYRDIWSNSLHAAIAGLYMYWRGGWRFKIVPYVSGTDFATSPRLTCVSWPIKGHTQLLQKNRTSDLNWNPVHVSLAEGASHMDCEVPYIGNTIAKPVVFAGVVDATGVTHRSTDSDFPSVSLSYNAATLPDSTRYLSVLRATADDFTFQFFLGTPKTYTGTNAQTTYKYTSPISYAAGTILSP